MKSTILDVITYVLVFVAIQLLVGFGFDRLWPLITDSQDVTVAKMVITTGTANILTIAVFLLARWTRVSRNYIITRPWITLFWCVIAAVGVIIPSAWIQEQMPELPNIVETELQMIINNRWGYVAVALLAPVAEEMVFRGAILRTLLDGMNNRWGAIAVSAALFALVHANPAQIPHAFAMGWLLGWMYYRTGSIVPAVAFHWINNSIAFIVARAYPDPAIKLADVFGSDARVYMALCFSLLIFLPALYQLNMWMRRG
jgi:membrane protease YdiL (CAAX protease family)